MPIELGCILLCKCTTYFILHQKILQKTSSHTYFTYRKILSSHLPPPHNKGAPPAALRLRAVRPKRAKVLLNKNFFRLSIRVADDVHTLLQSRDALSVQVVAGHFADRLIGLAVCLDAFNASWVFTV